MILLKWGGGELPVAFKGVLLGKETDQTLTVDVQTPVAWEHEFYDTDGFFDETTSDTRIVIPAGVSYVRFSGQISWASNFNSDWRTLYLIKNDVLTADPGGTFRLVEDDASNNFLLHCATSAVIKVVENDFFELYAFHSGSGGSLDVRGTDDSGAGDWRSWFGMEVVG